MLDWSGRQKSKLTLFVNEGHKEAMIYRGVLSARHSNVLFVESCLQLTAPSCRLSFLPHSYNTCPGSGRPFLTATKAQRCTWSSCINNIKKITYTRG
jgi:hypothetical protein